MRERWAEDAITNDVWSTLVTAALLAVLMASPQASGLPGLAAATEAGWQSYVAATERLRGTDSGSSSRFLAMDQSGREAERRAVLAGEVVVRAVEPGADAGAAEVPDARVHHWRGAVFLPATTVEQLVTTLERQPPAQADVLRARVLSRTEAGMHVYLRLRRQQIVTVVYDTEHLVRFTRHGAGRASSTSRAVRIREVRAAGTPQERLLSDDEDRDFLWRLNAYWRYQDVEGGVIAECESISLSRDVPLGLGVVARPLINRTAEGSMRAALLALRG